jgi:pyrroline-5-carboxylate reductase
MGLIYAHSLTQQNLIKQEDLVLIEKSESRRQELLSKNIYATVPAAIGMPVNGGIETSDVILLAVKPQDFEEVAMQLNGRLRKDCLVISIMAGIRIASMQEKLQVKTIVRAMPNAPALYGEGMTVYYCSKGMSRQHRQTAAALLAVTGKTVETKEEELLNAVTAVSGSGPAYFFYLAQQMIREAIVLGIEEKTAELLVKQTLLGAGVMLDQSGKSSVELVKTVASKGGTTEAALNVFAEKKLAEIVAEGLQQATRRARELAK